MFSSLKNFITANIKNIRSHGHSGRHHERRGILALDIGTEVVKALVCIVDPSDGKIHVKGVGKQKQRLGDMFNGGIIDIENVLKNCELATREAEAEAHMQTDQVILGIAGELVKGATVSVEYMRERKEEKITLPELRHIVHKIQWKAFERIRKELSWETGYSEIDVKLVHTALVDVRIDGYRVSNPLGFKGKHVQVGIFNAFAPLVHYESARSIAEEMNKELLSIVVEPYAVSKAYESSDGSDFSGIFIDIGGGTTDVALVQNGGIVGTKMYGIGGRVFTRRIARHLNLPFLEAEELKLQYSARKLTGKIFQEVEQVVKEDVASWIDGLELALREFEEVEILPSRILLCGGGSLLPEISGALATAGWHNKLRFARIPQISFICPNEVINVVDDTGKLKNQQDITPMGLANLLIDLAGEEPMLTKILKQVTRVIST